MFIKYVLIVLTALKQPITVKRDNDKLNKQKAFLQVMSDDSCSYFMLNV